ncbi:hypothetical protein [Jannaschia marina]|uniref:hypothetical protein n=1 Tax=Jannaschia marina TaxID=2741674 RepID=UPI0015CB622A|nr:hypothetical protein [Jannaschia marina]
MRFLLLLLLGFGLLLPRTGAVLADLAGFESMVICRGADMVTITIGADGTPVETEIEDHGPCLAAVEPKGLAVPKSAWTDFVPARPRPLRWLAVLIAPSPWTGPPPHRGPPAA